MHTNFHDFWKNRPKINTQIILIREGGRGFWLEYLDKPPKEEKKTRMARDTIVLLKHCKASGALLSLNSDFISVFPMLSHNLHPCYLRSSSSFLTTLNTNWSAVDIPLAYNLNIVTIFYKLLNCSQFFPVIKWFFELFSKSKFIRKLFSK